MTALRGLYAITAENQMGVLPLAEQVAQAIDGGARIIQFRDKCSNERARLDTCLALKVLCQTHGVLLIINDDIELAVECGAHGIHLGKDDADPGSARRRLGSAAIIGISCYDSWHRAEAAREVGADYVAFGSFYPSPTKPAAVRAEPWLLSRARRELGLPVVAIGGITPENGLSLVQAGADMLAVISGVFAEPQIRAAAQAYSNLFQPGGATR